MKFKDIKTGDIVFINYKFVIGFNRNEYFFIPKKVGRVTKTQFHVDSDRYKKDRGGKIGGGYGSFVYYEGDTHIYGGSGTVTDQTDDMNEFKRKVSLSKIIMKKIDGLNISYETLNLTEINSKLSEIIELAND